MAQSDVEEALMQVELNEAEIEILTAVLKSRLGDYSMQIADSQNSLFQEQLRRERETLQGIVDKLAIR